MNEFVALTSFTPADLAQRWDCHERTIQRMAARGEISHFRVGRTIRIPISTVYYHEERKYLEREE